MSQPSRQWPLSPAGARSRERAILAAQAQGRASLEPGEDDDRAMEDAMDEDAELADGEELIAEDQPEARGGCLRWFALSALLLLGIGALAAWGLRHVVGGINLPTPGVDFSNTSILPAREVKPVGGELQVQVYYVARGEALAPELRRLPRPADGIERAHMIAAELAESPRPGLLDSPLPAGARIVGLYKLDNILVVSLSPEFLQVTGGTPRGERLAVFGIVNNFMLNDPSLKGVQLLIDNKPAVSAWGWMDLSSPLGADLSLVKS